MKKIILLTSFLFLCSLQGWGQHSVARLWNEQVLEAIRGDFARPTIHARNLYHTAVAMYDAWAIYEETADTYFLGKNIHGFATPIGIIHPPLDVQKAQEEAMSYAVYRLILHRFQLAPEYDLILERADHLMDSLGFQKHYTSPDYACTPAGLGNYLAQQIIEYGFQDGSNEIEDYANRFYEPINPPMSVNSVGSNIQYINHWQPLLFPATGGFVGQGGFEPETPSSLPDFLSPEWGSVLPFSLKEEDQVQYNRNTHDYYVYHDPGPPPYFDEDNYEGLTDEFRWGHTLVAYWSRQLDPSDGAMWDISPASIGNLQIQDYPTDILGLRDFYDVLGGGDKSPGHAMNPKTNLPYEPQMVPRGDYARVLAEFWADGPDSETPPGHWFTILNTVNDHPQLVKKFKGEGEVLDDLEWDVKSYFMLGGAMHDAAIAAWGIKGWYDYVRPISAIRAMGQFGQSTNPNQPSYHEGGLPIGNGFIEIIGPNDLQFSMDNVGKIKIRAWRGNGVIQDPETDVAGVGWVLSTQWEPYQRPNFVTPPFAGYVSGHSTFSRAAAEVLTLLTGDEYFPGGMGEFYCKKEEFLVFENGPSVDVTLQWATYRDASDQCSLSRIWGGIHPPADDIPGRLIGIEVGVDAFHFAEQFFTKEEEDYSSEKIKIFPNPSSCNFNFVFNYEGPMDIRVFQMDGKLALATSINFAENQSFLSLEQLNAGVYFLAGWNQNGDRVFQEKIILL